MTFTATVHNGVIPLPLGVELPEGAEVEIRSSEQKAAKTVRERGLLKFAGIVEGPEDFAAEHDHYIHGTPKRAKA